MTDPKWARETENGRYYLDPANPDRLLISVTNALDELAIRGLAPAAALLTAEYIMGHLDEAVAARGEAEAREAFIKTAKAHYRTEWEKRMELGSQVHHAAERHVLGGDQPHISDQVKPFLGQYLKFLADFKIDLQRDVDTVECTTLHRGRGYGCTADLWVHLKMPDPWPSGRWLIDIKTSLTKPASQVYPQMVLQLAANRYAEVALDRLDRDFKVPTFVGAAILNLRPWSYGLVPLPADHNAYKAFVSLLPTVQWLHQIDLKPYKPVNEGWRKPRNWAKKQKGEVAA